MTAGTRLIRFAGLAVVAALTAGLALVGLAPAAYASADELYALINKSRQDAGLPLLARNSGLDAVAQGWTQHMAQTGDLQHNPSYSTQIPAGWRSAGENVGYAWSPKQLHDAWMNSAGHRANILSSDFNSVGLGFVVGRDGRVWGTQNFANYPGVVPPAPSDKGNPIGRTDSASATMNGQIRIAGWALDPDTDASVYVWLDINGSGFAVKADRDRPDIAAAFPGQGSRHGFEATFSRPPGAYAVCATAINVGEGRNTPLGCRSLVIDGKPLGRLDGVSVTGKTISVSGWALDPETAGPVYVWIDVSGRGFATRASVPRTDIGRAFPDYGDGHGFSVALDRPPGWYRVCATAVNVGSGTNSSLGCRDVGVAQTPPTGRLDSVSAGGGTLSLSGWALDVDGDEPIYVWVDVSGMGSPLRASQSRPDVASAFTLSRDQHGFSTTLRLPAGTYQACVTAIDREGGRNTSLGCSSTTVR